MGVLLGAMPGFRGLFQIDSAANRKDLKDIVFWLKP
jgi:hypothetical protein